MKLLLQILSWSPRWLSQMLGAALGELNFRFNTRSAKVTRANLELCLGEADSVLVRRSLIETGKTFLETPAVWLGNRDRIDRWIVATHGAELLDSALNSDKGLILLLPHTGNWELFNVFFARYGKMTALYQPPRQASMVPVMESVRLGRGNEMVSTTRQGLATLYRRLKQGGNVVVLPDQVPASGEFAPFFAQAALTDVLSHRLQRRTGATILGTTVLRQQDGSFDIHILEPDETIYSEDVTTSLSAINQLVERAARLDLAQYQWEYKRFRERPSGEAKIYRFNKPAGLH